MIDVQLIFMIFLIIMILPTIITDPSITLPLFYASPPPSTSPTPSVFSLPLTEQSMEFPFYNSSKEWVKKSINLPFK